MKRVTKRLAMASALAGVVLLAGGCGADAHGVKKQHVGTVVGGTVGGFLGSQIGDGSGQLAATAAGAVIGALIGSEVGRTMDQVDRMKLASTLEATPTGRTAAWHNPDTGVHYEATPTRTYDSAGSPCRDYTVDAYIDGRPETVTGTACRQPNGTWRTV